MKPPLSFFFLSILIVPTYSEKCSHCVDDLLSILNLAESAPTDVEKLRAVETMMNRAEGFLYGITPWSEIFAKGLKEQIQSKELNKLLKLLSGLSYKASEIERREKQILKQPHWFNSLRYQNLTQLLHNFYRRIETLNKQKLHVHSTVIDRLVGDCTGENSPKKVIEQFTLISEVAPVSEIYIEVLNGIMDIVHYYHYKNTTIDKKELQDKTTMIYLKLERFKKEVAVNKLRYFINEHPKADSFESRTALFSAMFIDFFREDHISWDDFDTASLFKAELLLGGYKGKDAIDAATVMSEHIYLTMAAASLCSNISFYDRPEQATTYINSVLTETKKPLLHVKNWYSDLLKKSWPDVDEHFIRKFIEESRGGDIPRDSVVYQIILNKLVNEIKGIGHPDYRYNFIMIPGYDINKETKRSEYIAGNAEMPILLWLTLADVHLFGVRTNWTQADMIDRQDSLISLVREMKPVILRAMDMEFYNADLPIEVLANMTKYGIDFHLDILKHRYDFILAVRNYEFFSGCTNPIAFKSMIDYRGRPVFPLIRYHYDAAWSTDDCEDWLFIFTTTSLEHWPRKKKTNR